MMLAKEEGLNVISYNADCPPRESSAVFDDPQRYRLRLNELGSMGRGLAALAADHQPCKTEQ